MRDCCKCSCCTSAQIDISRYSSLAKLQRIIATIIKASHLFKDASKEVSVTPQLLNQAKLILLRQQRITSQQQNSKSLSFFRRRYWNHTCWRSLITKSDTSRSEVPYLVHSDSHLAILILRYFHEATLHGRGQLTLNSSRSE